MGPTGGYTTGEDLDCSVHPWYRINLIVFHILEKRLEAES